MRARRTSGRGSYATFVVILTLLFAALNGGDALAASLVRVSPAGASLLSSDTLALSADGSTAIGQFVSGSGPIRSFDAYLWTREGGFRNFAEVGATAPGESPFYPLALSSDGSRMAGGVDGRAAIWEHGVGTTLLPDLPAGTDGATAYGISDDGRFVVGSAHDGGTWETVVTSPSGASGIVELPRYVPVSWDLEQGTVRALSTERGTARDVSDGGIAVGELDLQLPAVAELTAGFRWDETHGSQLVPNVESEFFSIEWAENARSITADGSIFVGSLTQIISGLVAQRAYAWSGSPADGDLLPIAGLSLLELPPDPSFRVLMPAMAISGDGSTIVGSYKLGVVGRPSPFVWTQARGFEDLEVLLASLGVSLEGWVELYEAVAVSADGRTILGTGRASDSASTAVWIAVIPEPSTALLLGAGLVCLSARRRGSECSSSCRCSSGRRGLASLVAVLLLLSSGLIASDALAASIVAVNPVGTDTSVFVPALSADGSTITGSVRNLDTSGGDPLFSAYLWTREAGFRTLGDLGPDAPDESLFDPRALSYDGTRIAGTLDGTAAVWERGVGTTLLPDLPIGMGGTRAYGISDDGRFVVGSAPDGGTYEELVTSPTGGITIEQRARSAPVRWDLEQGGVQALANERGRALDVSDGGIAVGTLNLQPPGVTDLEVGFRWDETQGSQLVPSAGSSTSVAWAYDAEAISADGSTIVGSTWFEEEQILALQTAYAWSGLPGSADFLPRDGMSVLDGPPGATSITRMFATAVSADGSTIVGRYSIRTGRYTPFIWTRARGFEDLEVLLLSLGVSLDGWDLLDAVDVSADGRTILGMGRISGRPLSHVWVAVIPEPSTALLLGAGLACLAARRRSAATRRDD